MLASPVVDKEKIGRVLPSSEDWDLGHPFRIWVLTEDEQWADLGEFYERFRRSRPADNDAEPERFKPWRRCLAIARANGAMCAVVEKRYIDKDYRSENSAVYSRVLSPISDTSHRLHFFSEEIAAQTINDLLADDMSSEPALSRCYLGYVTCRPAPLVTVGRTMLKPPPDVTARSQVHEIVSLFGANLSVSGVPFMQQDERLAVCAHVALWSMCYSSYLRGESGRRTIADIVEASNTVVHAGTQGLSTPEACAALQRLDYRPQLYRRKWNLPPAKPKPWSTWETVETLKPEELERPKHGIYDAEVEERIEKHIAGTLVPALNSGISIYVSVGPHAFLVCGYQKRRSLSDGSSTGVEYLVHDDQIGPYLRIWSPVRDFKALREMQSPKDFTAETCKQALDAFRVCETQDGLKAALEHEGNERQVGDRLMGVGMDWNEFLIPTPMNVHLEFARAEKAAIVSLTDFLNYLLHRNEETIRYRSQSHKPDPDSFEIASLLNGKNKLKLRTFLTLSSTFKCDAVANGHLREIAAQYRAMLLPQRLFVVELLVAEAGQDTPRVLGEILIDPTSGSRYPRVHSIRVGSFLRYADHSGNVWFSESQVPTLTETSSPGARSNSTRTNWKTSTTIS